MTAPAGDPEDILLQAATLAFALVRFETGAAHAGFGYLAPDLEPLGDTAWEFTPSPGPIAREAVPRFLATLPSPALLLPTTTRGVVALLLLSELGGDRAAGVAKVVAAQQAGVEQMAAALTLTPESAILLEFGEEVLTFPLAVLRHWSARFGTRLGWGLAGLEEDPRAAARLMLYRSDGWRSWGGACDVRPPAAPPTA